MANPWSPEDSPAPIGSATLTLIEGTSFCITDQAGRIQPGRAHGLFVRDTRLLNRWELRVDGTTAEPLSIQHGDPYTATVIGRLATDRDSPHLLVLLRHSVGGGLRTDIELRNLGHRPVEPTVVLHAGADFADLFEVKDNRVTHHEPVHSSAANGTLSFRREQAGKRVQVRIGAEPTPELAETTLRWTAHIPARGCWRACVEVRFQDGAEAVELRHPCGYPIEYAAPARQLRAWRAAGPSVQTNDPDLARTLHRSVEDLGSLRMFDPEHPGNAVVAAGSPWFMALFGRDSLLTSWLLLPFDHQLALGTLRTLAAQQGDRVDPATEEQPGKILHEMRFGATSTLTLGGGRAYYGSIDATPLFVLLLGELHRWGVDPAAIEELLPHADRAIDWVERYGDRDGDGFVEYRRANESGLLNQGWKDSWDAIAYADGTLARPPIALAEVQGYVYAAYRARARIAEDFGDPDRARELRTRADALKRRFDQKFWLPWTGAYALGLDADKRPIDALASNIGHCLWTGIAERRRVPELAARLRSPALFSGWGIRTLAATMTAYDPLSYHNGSVWPHDNALCVAGLARYGFVGQATRLAVALLDASSHFQHRLPELFCGFDRADFTAPVPYPTSCSPQAWASATPLSLLRTLLRLDPQVATGQRRFAPAVPQRYRPLRVERLRLGGRELTAEITADSARLY